MAQPDSNTKLQAPNPKHQRSSKLQIPTRRPVFKPRGGLFIDCPKPTNLSFCFSAPKAFGAEKQKEDFMRRKPAINRPPLRGLGWEFSIIISSSNPDPAPPVPVWRRYARRLSKPEYRSQTHRACRWSIDAAYQRSHGPQLWLDRKSPRRRNSPA